MITLNQIRAARALIGMTQRELADRSGVTMRTISNVETGQGDPLSSTLRRLQAALEAGGVEFVEPGQASLSGGAGVRLYKA